MDLSKMRSILIALTTISFVQVAIEAGGGGGSRYVNTNSYSGPKRTNVSIYEPLHDHIFEGYNPLAIPICEEGDPLHVQIDMWLYQLFDLDEPKQELTLDVWVDLNWRDCAISWNPEDFNGIKQITVPSHDLWFPDVFIYQSLHGNYEEGMFVFREAKVKLSHDGTIQMGAQLLLKTFCKIQIQMFPFDEQECPITYSAWNKNIRVFNMTMKPRHDEDSGHTFTNSSNGEWTVIDLKASDSVRSFNVGSNESVLEKFSEVTFVLRLKRKPQYIQIYLILPCLLLIWMAAITFYIPVSSGEKIVLVGTVLVSLFVFLIIISENVPHTSDAIPIIAKFFFSCIGLVSLGMIFTVLVLNVSHKSPQIFMPIICQKLLHSNIAHFFCVHVHKPPHKAFSDYQVLFKNSANATAEISPPWNDKDVQAFNSKKWEKLGCLLDRMFFLVYLILCLFLSLYILTVK